MSKSKGIRKTATKTIAKPRKHSWKGIHLPDKTFYRIRTYARNNSMTYAQAIDYLINEVLLNEQLATRKKEKDKEKKG